MAIRRHLALNGLANLVLRGVIAVRHLVLVPFFLAYWGPATFGEWITLSAVAATLALCNFGVSAAAANRFVLLYADGDRLAAGRIMRAGRVLMLLSVLGGGLLASFGLWGAYQLGFLGMLSVPVEVSVAVVMILGVSGLATFYADLSEAWFRAAREVHLGLYWKAGTHLARIVATASLLFMGRGMVEVALAELLITVAGAALMGFLGRRLLRDVSLSHRGVGFEDLKAIVGKGWSYLMTPVRRTIHLEGMTFVVRILGGAELVALYGTLRTFTNSLAHAFNLVNASILPEFQLAFGAGRRAVARRIFCLGVGTNCLIALAGLAAMLAVGPWLYGMWTGGTMVHDQRTWILALAGICVCATSCTAAEVLLGANQPELLALAGVLAAAVGVAVGICTIGSLGIAGAFLGTLVMETAIAVWAIPAACRILDLPIIRLPAEILALLRARRRTS